MSATEFWLAVWNNVHVPMIIITVLAGLGVLAGLCALFGWMDAYDEGALKFAKRAISYCTAPFFAGLLLCFLPTSSDLWRVRIDMIKLQLASPENVQAGVEHIDQVAKALECKYLDTNCPEKKQ